ncbi:galactose mutarotase-like protein [Testicularia cyperi]|uniref:Galactose mutarotase-like protein n=1 Tax=Testicularia cyperi TaxID=1882483 RepID=A0A317XQ12_9BASI|nr:galactose mutarotase-like protein [Testicularia cyperi]
MAVDPFTPIVLSAQGSPLKVSVLPYGLTIHSISTQPGEDFIAGPENPLDHKAGRAFLNPIIGRFANRLPAGKNEYKSANGKSYSFSLPEFSGPGVVLHGGPQSEKENVQDTLLQHGPLDKCFWQPLDVSESKYFKDAGYSSTKNPATEGENSLIFAIESPDGDSGYPGKLRFETLIAVVPGSGSDKQLGTSAGRVLIRYRTSLDADAGTDATPLNLTHHWGFNMSASNEQADKAEKGEVSDHVLEMYPPAGKPLYQLDLDSAALATGKLSDASGDASHFSNPGSHHWNKPGGKLVKEGIPSAGYDDFYVWGKDEGIPQSDDVDTIATQATRRLRFTSESAGRSLTFHTNQTGTQVYTAEGQPAHPADPAKSGGKMKQAHRKGGQPDSGNFKRSYAAIEFGAPHCGFLREGLHDFGGREEILETGQLYDNWVVCEAWTKDA